MEKKNPAPIWSFVSVLATVFFLLADLFVTAVKPRSIVLLTVFSVLTMAGMAVTLFLREKQKERDRKEMDERFEYIFKTEKAMFLLIKKTEDQFSSLDRKLEDSIEEVIKTQKAAAKIMVNRSRENADAIMNSNDKVMERFLDYEEKLDQNNELIGAQKASAEENFGKIVEKQTEIAASVDNLLDSVKKEIEQLADRLESSIQTVAEHEAAPSMDSFGIHEPDYRVQVGGAADTKASAANEFMAVPETMPEPEPQPEPLPDLDASEPLPELDMPEPLPDLDASESLPDLDASEPLPELDMTEPLPELDASEPLPELDAEPEKSPLDDIGLFDDGLNLNFDGIEGFGDELKAVNEELHPEQAQAEEVPDLSSGMEDFPSLDDGVSDLSGFDDGIGVFPTVDDGTEAPPVVDEEIINGEPVIEDILPEQKEPEPKPPAPDLSDPNKLMTPDEIAALIANM